MDYEWDERKAARNLIVHGVDFSVALKVFLDPGRMEFIDDREDYGEERWIAIGYADGRLLHVAHTIKQNGTVTRLISARTTTRREAIEYHENIGR